MDEHSRPTVSVIMNCHNSDKYLREAIDSVYAQSYEDFEIVFWDNASTDKSAEIAKSYDERLQYFKGDELVPLGSARNLAIGKARGKYVAFLDCDDVWSPGKLSAQIPVMEEDSEPDFLYGSFYSLNEEDGKKKLVCKGSQPEGYIFDDLLRTYNIGLVTVVIRKTALDRLETLFDPELHLVEEYDLFLRLLFSSKAAYMEEPTATYRIHNTMRSYTQREKWVEEYRYVNGKLRKFDKEGKHTGAIEYREALTAMIEALVGMAEGRSRDGRRALAPYKFSGLRAFAIYLATYLPHFAWMLLRPFWKGAVICIR